MMRFPDSRSPSGAHRPALLLLSLLLAACGPTPAAPPATPPPAATAAPPSRPFVLPPTWTPTFTFTPAPPTATRTPTLTPTVTPTPSDADRCAAFVLISHPPDAVRLALTHHDAVSFLWNYPLPGESVTLTITRAGTDLGRTLTVPGPDTVVATVPFRALYGPGGYRWSAAPLGMDGAPLDSCAVSGRFSILLRLREENRYPLP